MGNFVVGVPQFCAVCRLSLSLAESFSHIRPKKLWRISKASDVGVMSFTLLDCFAWHTLLDPTEVAKLTFLFVVFDEQLLCAQTSETIRDTGPGGGGAAQCLKGSWKYPWGFGAVFKAQKIRGYCSSKFDRLLGPLPCTPGNPAPINASKVG